MEEESERSGRAAQKSRGNAIARRSDGKEAGGESMEERRRKGSAFELAEASRGWWGGEKPEAARDRGDTWSRFMRVVNCRWRVGMVRN